MSHFSRLRRGLAVTAIVPFVGLGLTACMATSNSDTGENVREPKATSQETEGSGTEAGGNLPFPFPGGDDDASGVDSNANGSSNANGTGNSSGGSGSSGGTSNGSGTSNGGGSNSGGSSSGNVVKYDGTDLSNVNWSSICSADKESQYIIASDQDATGDTTGATLMVSADDNGKPDYLFISDGTSDGQTSLYWSDTSDAGSVSMSFNGDDFTATGEAFYFSDYSYKNPISFEIKLTCDITY